MAGNFRSPLSDFRLSALAAVLVLAGAALGAPSTSLPDEPLWVRADPINSPLLEKAAALSAFARQAVERLEQRPVPAQIGTAEVQEVGQAAIACYFLGHFGKQLAARSEAAGVDYFLRAGQWNERLRKVVVRWKAVPGFRAADLDRLAKQVHDAGLTQLPAIEAQIQQGQLEAAEKNLLAIYAEILRYAVWIDELAGKYYGPFTSVLISKIDNPLALLRQKKTADDLTALLAQNAVNWDELPQRLATATADVGRVGLAPWDGESVSGPELVARAGQEWQRMQVRAERLAMIELARRIGPGPIPSGLEQINSSLAAFNDRLAKGLAELVKADAARVPPENAAALYERYVTELARLALLGDRAKLLPVWEPALAELAAKDAAFKAEVDGYTLATTELLRWRRRVAAAAVKVRTKKAPTLDYTLTSIGRKYNVPGVLTTEGGAGHAAVLDPVPDVLNRWRESAVGQPATAAGVTGLGGGKSISRYQARTYSRFTVPVSLALDNESRTLKAALLTTPARRPLSLDAALAVVAAEQGSYAYVGGQISEIFLEPLLTRMMLLSDRSVGLIPLGTLPPEPWLFDVRSHVIARIDLAPQWVGHECFVVDLE